MAAQQRVQAYLEKHKISGLFEELMAKVINNTPTDPLVYLCTLLERKVEKRKMTGSAGISAMRKSASDMDGRMRGTAGAWATTSVDGGLAVAKERGVTYEKPWLSSTNTKRVPRPKTADETSKPPRRSRSPAKQDWNNDKKVGAKDFDEMFAQTQTHPRRSGSPTKTGTEKLWRSPSYEHELNYKSHGYTGPRHIGTASDLDAELSISSGKPVREKPRTSATVATIKQKGAKSNAMKHRQELQRYLQAQKKQEDSGIEDSHSYEGEDDGLDVWENLDDLKSEGVTNIKGSGIKIKALPARSGDPVVRVAICGRCAKIMTSAEPISYDGATESGSKFGELPQYSSIETQRSVQFSNVEDEDFESVSQVSGPRRPVWQDSDGLSDSSVDSADFHGNNVLNLRNLNIIQSTVETTTPRKGVSMFESHGTPNKGRPMYSRADVRDSMQSLGQSSAAGGGGQIDLNATAPAAILAPQVGGDTPRTVDTSHTPVPNWQRTMSEDLDERNVESPELLAQKGRSWAIPEDSEISDMEWDRRKGAGQKGRQAGGQY
ncbi:uncharacterized protein C8orf34 homolog isoform X2 [Lineus longissimus]|uniref:uncharacterized protein C8orf34 homolog isoform X2 n=1 Tax=Lineus longissimus TaxID=88925 RepID=UPI002B4EA2C5